MFYPWQKILPVMINNTSSMKPTHGRFLLYYIYMLFLAMPCDSFAKESDGEVVQLMPVVVAASPNLFDYKLDYFKDTGKIERVIVTYVGKDLHALGIREGDRVTKLNNVPTTDVTYTRFQTVVDRRVKTEDAYLLSFEGRRGLLRRKFVLSVEVRP